MEVRIPRLTLRFITFLDSPVLFFSRTNVFSPRRLGELLLVTICFGSSYLPRVESFGLIRPHHIEGDTIDVVRKSSNLLLRELEKISTRDKEPVSIEPGSEKMMPGLSPIPDLGVGHSSASRKNSVIRPKKKLTRLAKGLDPQVYRNIWFPQSSILQANKITNFVIPEIVIEKATEDAEMMETTAKLGQSFKRPEINAMLLHPSYAVCSAVAADDPTGLKNIILSGAVNVNQLNSSGVSALHEAAYEDKFLCVDILVQCGASLDLRDWEGWSPLHAAVCGGSKRCAAYLVKHGANTKARNDDGITPLVIAWRQRDKEMMRILTPANAQKENYYRDTKELSVPALTQCNLKVADYGCV